MLFCTSKALCTVKGMYQDHCIKIKAQFAQAAVYIFILMRAGFLAAVPSGSLLGLCHSQAV